MSKLPHRIGSMLTFICITLTFSLLTLILGTGGGITKEIDTAIEDRPGDVLEVYLSIGKLGSSGHQFLLEELERLEALVPSAEAIAAEAYPVGYLEHRQESICSICHSLVYSGDKLCKPPPFHSDNAV